MEKYEPAKMEVIEIKSTIATDDIEMKEMPVNLSSVINSGNN